MSPDKNFFDFIKKCEACKLKSYQDSAGIWTIGVGSILYADGRHVKQGDTITQEQADEMLADEVSKKCHGLAVALAGVTLTQNQYNALVSFAFNVGLGGLLGSTLLKKVKANPSDPSIRDAFMMWDKARVDGNLVEVQGLKNRRKAEADLYFS